MPEHKHNIHHDEHCSGSCCGVEIAEHEGALIGTVSGHISASDIENAKDILSSEMKRLGALINESGGVIGHIKAIVSEEGRGYQISVTDEEAVMRTLMPSSYHADVAVIIFAIEPDDLHELMEHTVGAVIVPEDDDCCCEEDR